MYNCIAVLRDGNKVAFFKTTDAAEMYIRLMQQCFNHLAIHWETEGCFVEGLVF